MSSIHCLGCGQEYEEKEYLNGICPNCGEKSPFYHDSPDENECGKCHSYVEPGDKYCRYCGSKAGVDFEPYWNVMETVYGPPPFETEHECKYCGHRWTAYELEWEETSHYCPECGKSKKRE